MSGGTQSGGSPLILASNRNIASSIPICIGLGYAEVSTGGRGIQRTKIMI